MVIFRFAMCEKMNAPSFQVLSWIPVLALLPNTYSDEELCENIITVLSKVLYYYICSYEFYYD